MTVKNPTEQWNLSTHTWRIKCKWENQAKEIERKVGGGGEAARLRLYLYTGLRGYKKHEQDKNFSNHNKFNLWNLVISYMSGCAMAKTSVDRHIQKKVFWSSNKKYEGVMISP